MKRSTLLVAALAFAALAGCAVFGRPAAVIPVIKVAGAEPGKVLVVVLPGFAFDADDLRDRGVADAIHRGWAAPDVALVGATFPYYRSGVLVSRLHEQVIAPARAQGYREIWLAGGSMGGMGVLLYEQAHPGELSGLLLMSPFLGDDDLLDEIRDAGLARWQPGELAAEMDGDNFARHVWVMLQGWQQRPALARRVWLVCGTEDRLFEDIELLAPLIPRGQYIASAGAHNWDYWLPAAEDTFRKIASRRRG
jgi:pimeloyl-ACP methyl ester carboxylesterase